MDWRGSKVVITGGAGFLGSHLCEALVERGADVTVIDDFSFGSRDNLGSVLGAIKLVQHRLGDSLDGLEDAIEGDVLFHLAAVADPRACKADFESAFRSNVLGLKACLERGMRCKRILYMSSATVYGTPDYVPIDEGHPLNGKDPYAVTKVLGEWLCRHYIENAGYPITIVRNFNSSGPRQSRAYLIPKLIGQALFEKKIEIWNAEPIRDFMFVSDTVEALLSLAMANGVEGFTINLGRGLGIKVGDLAEMIASFFKVPLVNLKKSVIGSTELVCDNSRLKVMTDWAPRVSLEDGLKATIEYFRHLQGAPLVPASHS